MIYDSNLATNAGVGQQRAWLWAHCFPHSGHAQGLASHRMARTYGRCSANTEVVRCISLLSMRRLGHCAAGYGAKPRAIALTTVFARTELLMNRRGFMVGSGAMASLSALTTTSRAESIANPPAPQRPKVSMTHSLPLILLRVDGTTPRCVVVISSSGQAPKRSIQAIEIVGQFRLQGNEVDKSVASFSRGREFTNFLHAAIARNGPTLPGIQAAVAEQADGYVYVIDGRTPTPQGRVPNEDIIGAFQIHDGKVGPDSYQQFEAHRLYTERGFFQLDDDLAQLVLKDLQASLAAAGVVSDGQP